LVILMAVEWPVCASPVRILHGVYQVNM